MLTIKRRPKHFVEDLFYFREYDTFKKYIDWCFACLKWCNFVVHLAYLIYGLVHYDLQTIFLFKDEILGGWVGQDNFVQKTKFKKVNNYEWPLCFKFIIISVSGDVLRNKMLNKPSNWKIEKWSESVVATVLW
jgi:hypothetical protein